MGHIGCHSNPTALPLGSMRAWFGLGWNFLANYAKSPKSDVTKVTVRYRSIAPSINMCPDFFGSRKYMSAGYRWLMP